MSGAKCVRTALVLAVVMTLVSCGRTGATPAAKGVFRMAITEPATLDPLFASQPGTAFILGQLFDGLVRYDDATAAIVPDMATSWEISPDSTRFTFHLRKGARFSNRELVSAGSFVRGMTRALSPVLRHAPGSLGYQLDGIQGAAAVSSGAVGSLSGVRAVDERTLVVQLSAPDGEFLIRCAGPAFVPMPSDAAVAAQRPTWGEAPIGNGPFMLAGWAHNQSITLVPNMVHGGGPPRVGRVSMTILPSADAAYAAWRAGQLDWAAFPASAMADVLRLGKDHYLNRPIANMDYLVVTGTAVPADAQSAITFRQALSQAIDRSHIVDTVLAGKASPASGLVPALVPGSASNDGAMPCGACRFDPARARALLVASGVTMTGALPLFYQSGSGEEAVMDGVAQDLRTNLAIQAEATPVTTTAASPGDGPFPGVAHPVAGIAVVGIARVIGTPVPDDVLRGLLEAGSGENLSGYANPAFDTQVAKARAVTDPGARAAAYQQAERLVLQDLPIVPLLWERGVRLARLNEWSRLGMDAFGNPTLRTLARAG